jgi:capsule polysaccharide export protein KpsE/RkpR
MDGDVMQTAAKPQPEVEPQRAPNAFPVEEMLEEKEQREWRAEQLRFLWNRRKFLFRAGVAGVLVSTLIAFLIPKSYTSTTQLMPPNEQSTSGVAMMAALASRTGAGLGSVASDLLGLKSSGALFIGVLRSQTSEEHIVDQFDLKKVYGIKLMTDARKKLDENTSIAEDRKSGIISISVTDHNPQRAAAIANAYVEELNSLVTQLSTSAAHRERVFLEERLKVAKRDLDDASNQLAEFSSKNNTLDIQTEGKAMLDAAGTIAGQMIAAQSELEGLRQIYTDNNARVRELNARVAELRKQLEKLSGTQRDDANNAAAVPVETVDPAPAQSKSGNMPFPTIRNLPLLGAKYSDYYRRAKIQETVFELLTEQYELAKVEEAKETPSVKVLDPGQVPERKSFPPKLLIMFLGIFLTFSVCVVWVLGAKQWQDADPKDPRKILAQEVFGTLKAQAHRFSRNGASSSMNGDAAQGLWKGPGAQSEMVQELPEEKKNGAQ